MSQRKYGEFKTVDELNEAAAELLKQGDEKKLVELAVENGIDKEDAEDYIDGFMTKLANPLMAAVGKLKLEAEELKLKSQLADWKDYVVQLMMEDSEYTLANAVFAPDKQLVKVLAAGLKRASTNMVTVDSRIIKAARLPQSAAYIGMVSRAEMKQIIVDYYMGGSNDSV